VVTLPKRKLPKLWYSKNDYKKERENESKTLTEQLQNDDATKTTINDETAEPLRMENQMQPNDMESNIQLPNDANPLTETESQSTTPSDDTRNQTTQLRLQLKIRLNNLKMVSR